MNETSKLYIEGGNLVGIKEVRRSHRGYIAKRLIPTIQKLEAKQFSEECTRITFREPIKVNEFGKQTYFI